VPLHWSPSAPANVPATVATNTRGISMCEGAKAVGRNDDRFRNSVTTVHLAASASRISAP